MPPSLTYWHRIEPRPRTDDLRYSLSAQIRDPAWMLARQWQHGEFQGEDAGSPAYIQLITQVADLQAWQAGDKVHPLTDAPLEDQIMSEEFTHSLSLRAEIGQTFEMLLEQRDAAADIEIFRKTYPLRFLRQNEPVLFTTTEPIANDLDKGNIPAALRKSFEAEHIVLSTEVMVWTNITGQEWVLIDQASNLSYAVVSAQNSEFVILRLLDRETLPFLRLCASRVIDGVALLYATPPMPNNIAKAVEAQEALIELTSLYADLIGPNHLANAPAWRSDRLSYQADVFARDAQATGFMRLRTQPERDGAFDWYTFDLDTANSAPTIPGPHTIREDNTYMQPNRLMIRGMPNVRWWEFENNLIDIGAIQPEKRDLSRLILMDFMLVAGNDWFMLPYKQQVGTACWVDLLAVHDVFGGVTRIKAAVPATTASRTERWSMFKHNVTGKPHQIVPFFILPPTAGSALQASATLEEVRFSRDEMASLVWAIEETTENSVGLPWSGREYDMATKPAIPATSPSDDPNAPLLRYLVQTPMPSHWIPFVPVGINEVIDGRPGRVKLEMVGLLDEQSSTPRGRILRPTDIKDPYRIWEEEVPREGMRIQRINVRSRWSNGQTSVWTVRRKSLISEQSSITLQFDQAISSL